MGLDPKYTDKSTSLGFQFEFQCERCGAKLLSRLQHSKVAVARGMLDKAASWLGGSAEKAMGVGGKLGDALGAQGRETAFRTAVSEAQGELKQCPRCGKWVCAAKCWNATRALCDSCAPDRAEEAAAIQAMAEQSQMKEMAGKVQRVTAEEMAKDHVACPHCGARVAGAKFCPECGKPMKKTCKQCGKEVDATTKFCPECGGKTAA